MNAVVQADALAAYSAAFETMQARTGPVAARATAFARFAELGFPGERDEAWKYTSLRRLAGRRFQVATAGIAPSATVVPSPLADHRILMFNGEVAPDASPTAAPPAGLRVRTLAEAIRDGEAPGALLRVAADGGTGRFTALNSALCPDALVIDVESGARSTPALQVTLLASGETGQMSHPRIRIRAAIGSEARIVLHHVGDDATERFVNAFVDVEVGSDAVLHLYRLQTQGAKAFQIERIDATIGQRGLLVVHDAQLGGSLARLDLHARLAAPGAAAELTGLFLADGTRHLDTHVRVDHLAPGTRSLQDYRGIAAGRGRAVFNGKAVVHQGAQQSNARQSSRNLLLTPGAEIDTKPELEIYADDVQCSHGATTGQLDPAAVFYLRSRGLSVEEARSALTRAFVAAVLSRMDQPRFAAAVHDAFDARLARLLEAT